MELRIDGRIIVPEPEETLRDLVVRLGLDSSSLTTRPLAAQVAGEVFTLNYIPVRQQDAQKDTPTMRRAVKASGGKIKLLRFSDRAGKEAYVRTAKFVVFLALHQLWPEATAEIRCSLGSGIYIGVENAAGFDSEKLRKQIAHLIAMGIPLFRRRVSKEDAIARYASWGRTDLSRLLAWRSREYFDEYAYEDFADYYCGETMPSTDYLTAWNLVPAENGIIFVFPTDDCPDKAAAFEEMPRFMEVYSEGERWGKLMECETVSDLNDLTVSGKIRELIRVNEALHEKRFSQIADLVCRKGAKLVMLAGPSSSGKTTSANRLATQLRVFGKKPILMSLDDYYLDRDKILPGPDGKLDLEHINTIDVEQFRLDMGKLLSGEAVYLPRFNFVTGRREATETPLQLNDNSVIIVEGLHGLNPVMLPENVESNMVFRLYVSPLIPLNLDNHNRIGTSYLRLLRRIVRDYSTRGSTVQHTLSMWESVQRGEKTWIYPYQENADVIFNSSTLYELAVLKKYVFPLLTAVGPEDEYYDEIRGVVKFLDYVAEADVEDEIPPTSIVREFIGGNRFYL